MTRYPWTVSGYKQWNQEASRVEGDKWMLLAGIRVGLRDLLTRNPECAQQVAQEHKAVGLAILSGTLPDSLVEEAKQLNTTLYRLAVMAELTGKEYNVQV